MERRAKPPARSEDTFGFYPTPLHPLDRLSDALGGRTRIWVKRDDQTGLALGGNKVRKLEFLVADARQHGADVIITSGGRQSNHCRQTAAAAARVGLRCILVLTRGAFEDQDYQQSGNVLLDRMLGAELVDLAVGEEPSARVAGLADELRQQGARPYLIPVGGSTPQGSLGYVQCAEEILATGHDFSSIFLASGSGGTQAGLLAGLRLHDNALPVVGISVGAPADALTQSVLALAAQTAVLLGASDAQRPVLEDVLVDELQIGPGYGHPTPAALEAIHMAATTEGLLLDPVYTGKAMAGLLQAIRHPGSAPGLGSDVLFLHTGGQVGLFAYRESLTEPRRSSEPVS